MTRVGVVDSQGVFGTIKSHETDPADMQLVTGAQKTLVFNTPVYDDIIIYAANLRPGGTPPSFVAFQDSIYAISFINGSTDIVYGAFEIPHTYKEESDIEIHLHWSPSTTDTGSCDWLMKYTIAGMLGTFGAEQTLTFAQAGSGTVNKHQYVTANALIAGAGITIGTVIAFALSRPAGDGFSGDAFLHSVGAHYLRDTLGSRRMGVK